MTRSEKLALELFTQHIAEQPTEEQILLLEERARGALIDLLDASFFLRLVGVLKDVAEMRYHCFNSSQPEHAEWRYVCDRLERLFNQMYEKTRVI